MATKNAPGEFDCYEKAGADEPVFTLRAKDPLAPVLVRLWSELRALTTPNPASLPPSRAARETRKRAEALECAQQMECWRSANYSDRQGDAVSQRPP
ncbi:MAG: hypothetical protein OXG35_19360 [Acidobacteria bacterium]|nr:hypothetical protein [Acidobacteriota bacterium]